MVKIWREGEEYIIGMIRGELPSLYIGSCFTWHSTPQGSAYWSAISSGRLEFDDQAKQNLMDILLERDHHAE